MVIVGDYDAKDDEEKLKTMGFIMHMADISNPTKTWALCYKWTELLFCEFFYQGDKEREQDIPIGPLMDRNSINIPKAQVGFLDVIIIPAYDTLV